MKADISKSSRTIQTSVIAMEKVHEQNDLNQHLLEDEKSKKDQAELLLREKIQENIELRSTNDSMKEEYDLK